MARLKNLDVYNSDEDGHNFFLYTTKDASPESIIKVLTADPDEEDGMTRSQWVWLRTSNGDLALALFPQDDLYFEVEADACGT